MKLLKNRKCHLLILCLLVVCKSFSGDHAVQLALYEPSDEVEKELEKIRSRPPGGNEWAQILSEGRYRYFRKQLNVYDAYAARVLGKHSRNAVQRYRYNILSARWGRAEANARLCAMLLSCDPVGSKFWKQRGLVLEGDFSDIDLTKDVACQNGFIRVCADPRVDVVVLEAGCEFSGSLAGVSRPGQYRIGFIANGSTNVFEFSVKPDHLTEIRFDPGSAEFKTNYLALLDADLGFEPDFGFPNERTFVVAAGTDIILRRAEPGSFLMSDVFRNRWRLGVRRISIKEEFWLSRHEITCGVFAAVMKDEITDLSTYHHPALVTFSQAKEFCLKLTEIEQASGRIPKDMFFSLPTERQWEYALLAGGTDDHSRLRMMSDKKYICSIWDTKSLTDELDKLGWFRWNDFGRKHAVGQKAPNIWGLYDMVGGVDEMCLEASLSEFQSSCERHCIVRGSKEVYTGRRRLVLGGIAGFRVCLERGHWRRGQALGSGRPHAIPRASGSSSGRPPF